MGKKKKLDVPAEEISYIKCKKTSFNNIIRDYDIFHEENDIITKINDAVNRTTCIVTNTYNFIRAYIIHCYDKKINIPKIDEQFVSLIMNTVSKRTNTCGRKSEHIHKDKIEKFYNDNIFKLMKKENIINDNKLSFILHYEAIDMITNIENNIREHFIDHVKKLIKIKFNFY